jgi:iron complex transport system ATP-binding protein
MMAGREEYMITLEGVSIGYRPLPPLLEGIDLAARKGEMIALVGRNGSGKSTLLRSILGLIPLLEGECRLDGIPLEHYDYGQRARTLSYVASQSPVLPDMRVRELVSLGRIPHTPWTGRMGKEDRDRLEQVIGEVGLSDFQDRRLEQLSDGERQRVMIARALVQDTPAVLLDEPGAYLDIPNKFELLRLLSGFRDRGKTILYSTHDLETALMSADRFWVILDGRIHEGAPEDLGIDGLFERLFTATGISFDPDSGRYRYTGITRGRVSIRGEKGRGLVWTRHALERLGFETLGAEAERTVKVEAAGKGFRWILEQGGSQESHESLYNLARSLTREK